MPSSDTETHSTTNESEDRAVGWHDTCLDWALRMHYGQPLYELSCEDREFAQDLSVIDYWIEISGLTWAWKTPKENEDFIENLDFPLKEANYIANLGQLSVQPHIYGERSEFLREALHYFFLYFPEVWLDTDTFLSFQNRVIAKAKAVKGLLQFEALNRIDMESSLPWERWIKLSPGALDIFVTWTQRAYSKNSTNVFRTRYPQSDADSDSGDEKDWEEEFWKLPSEERHEIKLEWEEEEEGQRKWDEWLRAPSPGPETVQMPPGGWLPT